jgi:hypothetical protein
MLQEVELAGTVPVLLKVLPTALASRTNGQIRALDRLILALGALRHVRIVDPYPLFIHRRNLLKDGVHPYDAGYALIAHAVGRLFRAR